jgi:vesicle-fusing ATPase
VIFPGWLRLRCLHLTDLFFLQEPKSPVIGSTDLLTFLLHGPRGSGTTALAARIAMDSGFPFIRLLRAVDMDGMNEMQKIQHMMKVFNDAYKSPLSIVVIDQIELILDWVPIGPRFSNAVLSSLKARMGFKPPKGRKLLIIGTTSERTVLKQLGIFFDIETAVPRVRDAQELGRIMEEAGGFQSTEIQRALGEIEETTGRKEIDVGVKEVLLCVKHPVIEEEDRVRRFADLMSAAMAKNA